jgi:GT2 family glycosyltransferase
MQLSIYPIVVNWNLAEETIACVRSLLAAGAHPGQIIIVDNGSTDGSAETLCRALGDAITLINSPTNLGFAGGNNLALRYALERGAEWLLPINNDTCVAPTFFAELAAAVEEHAAMRVIGPLILYHDEPERVWSLGDCLIPGTLITYSRWRDQIVPATLSPWIEVDFINACCSLVHRSVLETIGLFDANFFMYAEDADFCWRARQAGFRLGCATRARMWHKVSRSTGVHHPQARYWRVSNQIAFYRRYAQPWQVPLMFMFTLLRSLKLTAVDLGYGRTTLARRTVQAWADGWFHDKLQNTIADL